MSDLIFLSDYRPTTDVVVEFSQCPGCQTYFGFTEHPACPACHRSFCYLPDVDDELRVFINR